MRDHRHPVRRERFFVTELQFVTTNPDHRTMLHEAVLLERSGRLPEAEAAYERLLARWPDLPESWYNLAVLQRRAGRFDAALASYRQALDRGVSKPEEVHLNRGVIYSDFLRQDAAAEEELRAALALNPDYVPALVNLANLKEDLGQRDEALAVYERILALEPDSSEALARYAELKSVPTPDDPLVARLDRALSRRGATSSETARLGFALGKVLDACGAHDRAFDAYAAANRRSRECAGPLATLYDRGQQERFVDQLIEAFGQDRLPAVARASSPRPIFICGMFRSGSTLTEQVLARHPEVAAGGEIDFLPTLVRTELSPYPARMAQLARPRLEEIAARYLASLSRLFPGAANVTDKRPDNFLHIGVIKTLFPDARIVHTTRDPLDNCLSIYFLHLDHSMGHALDLMDTGHYYRQYRRLMAHWKARYGADILDFDYDSFVRAPRPAVERLLEFCGLGWEENCLSFHRATNAVKTASVWQVREPLYQRSSGRWRNYARQLAPLRVYLTDLADGASPGTQR
jgi:tetratricopeptide (TPR) repeat protein